MKSLWVIKGIGRCIGTITFIRATLPTEARDKLLRTSPFYEIDQLFGIQLYETSGIKYPAEFGDPNDENQK